MAITLSQLPRDYEVLVRTGRTSLGDKAYLDALDAEWIPQTKLGDKDLFYFPPLLNLVPFAVTGGRDFWCWHIDVPTRDREFEIVFCPRDDERGDRWAPTFSTWAFRKAVEEATAFWDPESESRAHLSSWSSLLLELGHSQLAMKIDEINARPLQISPTKKGYRNQLTWQFLVERNEYQDIVCQFVGPEYWKAPIRWMNSEDWV